jgi:hypothetical protein
MLSQPFAPGRHQSLLVKGILLAVVLAVILLAHGCHSHEDNELFTSCTRWISR